MKKKFIFIIPVLLLVVTFVGVYFYFNSRDNITNLTISEKRWIEQNSSQKVDIEIYNNYPVYGDAGVGVFFDFIKDFEDNTDLLFNRIPYTDETTSNSYRIRILRNEEPLSTKDILIAEDNYVAISKNNKVLTNINNFANTKVAVLKDDSAELTYYLKTADAVTFIPTTSISELVDALNSDKADYIIVPKLANLDVILENNNYYINYNFNEMTQKIVLTLSDNNEELNNIISKYYRSWKSRKYVSEYNKQYFNYYVAKSNINDKAKADLVSKTYVYGYVKNDPYEVIVDGEIQGLAGEYIQRIKRLTNIEFEYKEYKNINDLKEAINNKEIDLYFDYFNLKNEQFNNTASSINEKYVVLSRTNELLVINSFESLKGLTINMMKDNALFDYVKDNSRANVKEFSDLKKLANSNGIKVVDYEIYIKHKNDVFKNLIVIYEDQFTSEYTFAVNKEDKTLYDLLNHVVSTNSFSSYRIMALNNLNLTIFERTSFGELYFIILGIIALPLLITLGIYLVLKNKRVKTEIVKEDRRKYTDMLTSLKNRNYLNANIKVWDDSAVYPQAVVMIDLNNIKYVNDNYGHEAGDNLIVKAAGILVNTQLENSEIIRTDGNEFLIYLVGYTEQQIITYTKKIRKELKSLPHGFGAELGFSMILDDIKLLDDAINEATIQMKDNKDINK